MRNLHVLESYTKFRFWFRFLLAPLGRRIQYVVSDDNHGFYEVLPNFLLSFPPDIAVESEE